MTTLYERLGGQPAVTAAVDLFYAKVLSDPGLKPFFAESDTVSLRRKQAAFMTYAFGGPTPYSGKGLEIAHRGAVAAGLGDLHFDAVAGHLQATLMELGVPTAEIAEAMSLVGGTREAVLGRRKDS